LAERLAKHDLLVDGDPAAVDDGAVEAEVRLAARGRGMGENIERRGHDRRHAAISEGVYGVLHPAGADVGERAGSGEQRALHFIGVVEHPASRLCAAAIASIAGKANLIKHIPGAGGAALRPRH
jgi:hypothetical protein